MDYVRTTKKGPVKPLFRVTQVIWYLLGLIETLLLLRFFLKLFDANAGAGFSPGLAIDFAKSKNDYVTDDILNTLNETLQAINDKNKDNFVKVFIPGKDRPVVKVINISWVHIISA